MEAPVAHEPDFQTESPNDDVALYEGKATLYFDGGGRAEGEVEIKLAWLPKPKIAFFFTAEGKFDHPSHSVTLELPDLDARSEGFANQVTERGLGSRGKYETAVGGRLLPGLSFGPEQGLTSVKFHLPNFLDFHGHGIHLDDGDQRRLWAGRMSGEAQGWQVEIDSIPAATGQLQQLDAGGYLITHVGVIRRRDGGSFSRTQAIETLEGLRLALSFAKGLWTAPILVTGYWDAKAVWSEWQAGPIDPILGATGWFPKNSSQLNLQMSRYLEGFFERWMVDELRPSLKLAVSWYLEANRSGVAEPSIATEQMGLELIAWLTLVRDGGLVSPRGFGLLEAHDQLRLLLGVVGVDLSFPAGLSRLKRWGQAENLDTAGAFTQLRNRIVHPPRRQSTSQIDPEVLVDAQQLGLWFLELAILAYLGYQGEFKDRLRGFRTLAVPWSATPAAPGNHEPDNEWLPPRDT